MTQFPQVVTQNLILGKIQASDIPKIVEYAGNIKVAQTTLDIPHPYAEKDAIFWINSANQGFAQQTQFTFGIRIKRTNEFVGGIGLNINQRFNRGELGYWIAEPFWNRGFATEATSAVLEFGFNTLGLNKIFAMYLLDNTASGKVMIKNGMIKEGELKDHNKKGDEYRSLVQYRLTKAEFDNRNGVTS